MGCNEAILRDTVELSKGFVFRVFADLTMPAMNRIYTHIRNPFAWVASRLSRDLVACYVGRQHVYERLNDVTTNGRHPRLTPNRRSAGTFDAFVSPQPAVSGDRRRPPFRGDTA
jgi:hypothetical protein